jgi:uncharacterized damage-inducible protein DinB
METTCIERFHVQWKFVRSLTRDLLESLEPDELAFSPGGCLGPLWKHFRHIGRVQENYMQAMDTGRLAFGVQGGTYVGNQERQSLVDYLDRLDARLAEKLSSVDPTRCVDWFGVPVDTLAHLTRMTHHEILHHGMFVVYVRLLGRSFPPAWAAWGL